MMMEWIPSRAYFIYQVFDESQGAEGNDVFLEDGEMHILLGDYLVDDGHGFA